MGKQEVIDIIKSSKTEIESRYGVAKEGHDFEIMDRLFEKGYILDPRGKSKSVVLTKEGLDRSRRSCLRGCSGRSREMRGIK